MKNIRGENQKARSSKKDFHDILLSWEKSVSTDWIKKQKIKLSRRTFLVQTMGVIGAIAIPNVAYSQVTPNNKSEKIWLTLSEVQEHLFPRIKEIGHKDFSPSAKDINAIGYLQAMLDAPDADNDEVKFIFKGVAWLDQLSNTMLKASFVRLNTIEREQVLQKISASETGETWLSTLLRYIFEALLTDPIYGGNTNSMGWKWLEHQPGFPRPPEDKKYWMPRQNKSDQNKSGQKKLDKL